MGNSPKETTTKNGDTKSPVVKHSGSPIINQGLDTKADASKLALPAQSEADYFSKGHNQQHIGHHSLQLEANPFEQSFSGGGGGGGGSLPLTNGNVGQTPGGTKLPGVASITSPAGILGTGNSAFWGGLRQGPLSPAMLSGPNKEDYFGDGHHIRTGFTPNESSLRTGLTPGGGGSMFPEPSPSFMNGGLGMPTPTTMDFHRTAIQAARLTKTDLPPSVQPQNITSQPQPMLSGVNGNSAYEAPAATDAANSLYMLANANNGRSQPMNQNHYTNATQAPIHGHGNGQHSMAMPVQQPESSPPMNTQNMNGNEHRGSTSGVSGRGLSEVSEENEQQRSRPNTRGKGKRNSTGAPTTNGMNGRSRKAEDGPAKGPAPKKGKGNNGSAHNMPPPSDDSEDEQEHDMSKDQYNANGKKMTDEEKRKNFLERNRVAALKCRQRKKQWLANLQNKVEAYAAENENLQNTIQAMRDENVNLKTMLLAHKDCPLSQQQGLHHMNLQQSIEYDQSQQNHNQLNPYGMAAHGLQTQQQVMNGQGMERRYS